MMNNKGFSLVELIVVIAIMAILASVAVVSYSVYIDRAQNAVDERYLADVIYRAKLFAVENQIPLEQVVIAPEVDGPEDILLVIGKNADGSPIYYTGDTSEIYNSVGNVTVQGDLNNGVFEDIKPQQPEKTEGSAHEHVLVENIVPSNCKKPGTKTTTCTGEGCNYKVVESLPLSVTHAYSLVAEQDGFAYHVCDHCGRIIIKSTNGTAIVPIG